MQVQLILFALFDLLYMSLELSESIKLCPLNIGTVYLEEYLDSRGLNLNLLKNYDTMFLY